MGSWRDRSGGMADYLAVLYDGFAFADGARCHLVAWGDCVDRGDACMPRAHFDGVDGDEHVVAFVQADDSRFVH